MRSFPLINNSIDLLDELNCSTNDDHSMYMLVSESDHEDLSEILEKVIPNAPEKMELFLMSQHEALSAKSPQARRWNKDVISLCLSLWIRSPKAYQTLRLYYLQVDN